ncbi:MAG: CocE/NonD family hydrolase [Hyphomonadaceae bacterium]
MFEVRAPEVQSLVLSDGVRLAADVYRPQGRGEFPVLLMRQPYGRAIASTVCYAHPSWYAAHGYIVVIQDVRGRGGSEGVFALFENEARDGAESVEWAAQLPGAAGAVGMYGFSYQGETQMLAATRASPRLKAIAPAMVGWDLRRFWAYENDAFCLSGNLGWALQLAAEEAKRAEDEASFSALYAAARALPLGGPVAARPALLDRLARYAPHYFKWLDDDRAHWERVSAAGHAPPPHGRAPALFVGGWFDTHLAGTVAAFQRYEAEGARAHLVVGPWAHFPWGRRMGDVDFGEAAIGDVDRLQLRWFDHWLKGEGAFEEPAVRLFDMGAKTWRASAAWPTPAQEWRLSSDGRAALDERSGMLAPDAVESFPFDAFVHDPWRPAPSVGGAFAGGPVARDSVDSRTDVATFTTAPLSKPLALAGAAHARLQVRSAAESIDLSCVLSRVDGGGRATYLTDGYRSFARTPSAPAVIPLRPTCATLAPGERLRVAIAGASFPNFPVNPGDGQRPADAALISHRVYAITLRHDGEGCSLSLPVLAQGWPA